MRNPTLLRRSIAFLMDLLILNAFILSGFRGILQRVFRFDGFSDALESYSILMDRQEMMIALTALTLLMALFMLAYFTLTEYLIGASFGMLALNMSVVDQDSAVPGLFKCMVRNLFTIPFFPFILLWVLDPLFLILRRQGQRFTEFITQTRVVYHG